MTVKPILRSISAGALIMAAMATAAAPLGFSATFPQMDGGERTVNFTGTIADNSITGQFTVDGRQLSVVATVAERSISGRFVANDREVGHFAAKIVGRELTGSHDIRGEVGTWSIPLSRLPAAARQVLECNCSP